VAGGASAVARAAKGGRRVVNGKRGAVRIGSVRAEARAVQCDRFIRQGREQPAAGKDKHTLMVHGGLMTTIALVCPLWLVQDYIYK
jgi:hypothetical protein